MTTPSGGTWKYAKAPSTKKKPWRDSLPIDMLFSAVSVLVVAQSSSEIPEGLMNNPVFSEYSRCFTQAHTNKSRYVQYVHFKQDVIKLLHLITDVVCIQK